MRDVYRTDDWARLSRTRLFKIDDEPGRIAISASIWPFWSAVMVPVTACAFTWLLLQLAFGGGLGGGLIVGLIVSLRMFPLIRNYSRYSYRVIFLPERIEFYGPMGTLKVSLSRDAMQQISITKDSAPVLAHRFISDTGWATAFPLKGRPNETLLRNNLLIAAIKQPLRSDVVTLLAAGVRFGQTAQTREV